MERGEAVKPTDAQLEVLEAIQDFQKKHGFSPSIREIGDSTGRSSTNAVHEILNRLQRDGFISRKAKTGRTIQVIKGATSGS